MTTRRLKITEETLKLGTTIYYAGDIKSFPKAEYIRLGWAEDAETGETGVRKPGSNGPLKIDSVVVEVGAS